MSTPLFVPDAEILVWLQRPYSLDWIACKLGASRQRVRTVRDANKTLIINTRIKEHQQHIDSIVFHLDYLTHHKALTDWYAKIYGAPTHAKH